MELEVHNKDMSSVALKKKIYPYIVCNPKIADGAPLIDGTRIAVRTIAGYYQMGMNVDEILSSLSHLTPSQVHSALAYYFDHQKEIDSDLAYNSDIDHWKERVQSHPHQNKNPS